MAAPVSFFFEYKYQCPVMIVQGSAGNIAPKYYNSTVTPVDGQGEEYINSVTALDDMAQEVMNKAEPIFNTIKTRYDMKVYAYSKYLSLQSKIPSMDEANQIADEALKYCGISGQKWLKEVERLEKSDYVNARFDSSTWQIFI